MRTRLVSLFALVLWMMAGKMGGVAPAFADEVAADGDAVVYVCTSRRMVAIGPRALAETRSVDEIRDLTLKRRYASVEEPRFREFVVTVAPAELETPFARDVALACRRRGQHGPVCSALPRWRLSLPVAKSATVDQAGADEKGRVALYSTGSRPFRAVGTAFNLTPEGLFTLVRFGGTGRSEMEEGLCARQGD